MTRHVDDSLPPFPSSPEGVGRMEHLPTVEACIRYWEAMRVYAIQAQNPALEWTDRSLRSSYEHAHEQLKQAAPLRETKVAVRAGLTRIVQGGRAGFVLPNTNAR